MRELEVRQLGRMPWGEAFELQRDVAEQRKRGLIPDQLLIVEHPHTITLGRNGREENLLASFEQLRQAGVEFHETDRGGDITYHGPGQIVGYPILDLREWKRDVVAYLRALEQAIIDALAEFGIEGTRSTGETGVWVGDAKLTAIGIHISRWITTHGFALNHTTDLRYFDLIVPCGLHKPVTSLANLGCNASREQLELALIRRISEQFLLNPVQSECATLERT
ncbi:MAG TPA: lipoyl(octanoyl) transferase LipB [Bryobacteraceae bacterium]|nr:lipoyl(octanoyl) transferase LipB [Bryobacteraceae bacterium]